MRDYAQDFYHFGDVIWLNAASEGPLPLTAKDALMQAVEWKSAVHQLDIPKFIRLPLDLKKNIAELIHVDYRDVILGNSASYGLHLLSDGLPWEAGDDVIVMENDFPTNILPWLALEDRGVTVRQVKPTGWILTPEEVEGSITPQTKLLCLSHVHTFSGHMLNVPAVTEICRRHGVVFVLNVVQSVGNRPVDVSALGVDAVVAVGYKWLCGPYGTGFCWFKPELRKRLRINRAYWSSYLTEEELKSEGPIARKHMDSARPLDTYGTANFFNFVPLDAALRYWLDLSIERVHEHNNGLINVFIDHLDSALYDLISPTHPDQRTNLVVISHKDPAVNQALHQFLLDRKIHTALWKGRIRLAPHVYNNTEQLCHVARLLNTEGARVAD